MSFDGAKKIIGIDVGSDSLKAVLLERSGETIFCKGVFLFPFNPNEVCPRETLVQALVEVKKKFGSVTLDVAILASERHAKYKFFEKPYMSKGNLDMVISTEMNLSLSSMENADQLGFRYCSLGKTTGETGEVLQILSVTFPKNYIEEQFQLIAEAGLQLYGIYTYAIVLREVYRENFLDEKLIYTDEEKSLTIIINLGASTTQIIALDRDLLRLARGFPSGGEEFTKSCAKNYRAGGQEHSLTRDDAENFKRLLGLLTPETKRNYESGALELQVVEQLRRTIDRIAQKLRLSLDYFKGQVKIPISRAFVVGGGACTIGISEYFQEVLQIPDIQEMFPFLRIKYSPLVAEEQDPAPDLQSLVVQAVGTGICAMKSDDECQNLLGNLRKEIKKRQLFQKICFISIAVVLVIFGGFYALLVLPNWAMTNRINADLNKIQSEHSIAMAGKVEYDKLVKERNQFLFKKMLVDDCLKTRISWSQLFRELCKLISKDVWLTEFSTKVASKTAKSGDSAATGGQAKGVKTKSVSKASSIIIKPIRMNGKALNYIALSQFLQKLEKSGFFKNVKWEESKRKSGKKSDGNEPSKPGLTAANNPSKEKNENGEENDKPDKVKEDFLEFSITCDVTPPMKTKPKTTTKKTK